MIMQVVYTFQSIEKKALKGRKRNDYGAIGKLFLEQQFCKLDTLTYCLVQF